MSARDKLIVTLRGGDDGPGVGIGWEQAVVVADRILGEHAHELAEEIRKDAGQHRVARERWAALRAAELIDPEVPGG